MKLYLTIALVALLFNFGAAKHVPRNLKTSASDDVVVQETAAESDLLDNNVVDHEALVNNDESGSNSVNLLTNLPEVALVQNAPTKTLSTKTLTPVQTLSVQTATVQTAPLQTVNVLKSQAPVQNLVTKSAPLATSKTVVYNQVPTQTLYSTVQQPQTVRYYQVSAPQQQQQQVVYSVQQPQQQQQWVYTVPSQQVYQAQPQQQQQLVSVQAQPQQQLVSVQAQPQQQLVSVQAQPQQQLVSVQAQPQQQLVSVQAQPQQNQQQLVLLRNSNARQQTTSGRSWVDQTPLSRSTLQLVQPQQNQQLVLTKTRAPNPLVYTVQPSRQATLSRQTVLSGAQLSSDVADESRASDFVVQEAESSY